MLPGCGSSLVLYYLRRACNKNEHEKTSCQFFRCYCSWKKFQTTTWDVSNPVNNGRSTTNLNWWTPDFFTINCIIMGWPPLPTNITTGATGIIPPRRDAAAKVVTVPDKCPPGMLGCQDANLHLPPGILSGGTTQIKPVQFPPFLFFPLK